MDVSRRDFIRLGTSAAVTTTAVAQAGGAQSAPVLLAQSTALSAAAARPSAAARPVPPLMASAVSRGSALGGLRYVTLEPGDRRGVSDRIS